ncbi:MAG: hypothetical protein K8R58_01530, partial [Bacteroidales bacterium]|nr:hypothetical protein [Bacteroidales bacterium]
LNWSHQGTYGAHWDFHEFIFSPWNDNELFMGTDGALWKKNFSTNVTTELNNRLGVATMFNMCSSFIDPDQILTGHQDCGVNYYKDQSWSWEFDSDGFECLMDYYDINLMYATDPVTINGSIHRSSNDCNAPSWSGNIGPTSGPALFGAALIMDPANSHILYQGRQDVWKTINAPTCTNSDWTKISDFPTHFPQQSDYQIISGMEIAPSDPDYIYLSNVNIGSWLTAYDETLLLKTTSGGGLNENDWTDITPDPANHYYIKDVAVSSYNPDHIWACYSGYYETHKVKMSTDGGNTWYDYGEGLPNIPVNCIIYENGSNDAVYIGTDVGVYYRNETMTQWEPFMDGLPNVNVRWLEINYNKGFIRAATYGRGLWESPIPCQSNPESISITEDLIWYAPQFITNDIIIEPNCTLTVKNLVKVADNNKFIVKRGGKLFIDGGIITDACGDMWQGIEVWGNSNQPQLVTEQGWVKIINNGTIENSKMGIYTNRPDPEETGGFIQGYTGGIIQATDAHFINNKIAVKFYSYAYHSVSTFNDCGFKTDEEYIGSEEPEYFMEITGMDGVQITSCDFTNDTGNDDYGSGIYSHNSYIKLDGKCTSGSNPCTEWENNLFKNLYYGVYATDNGTEYYVDIRHSTFGYTDRGIYISGIDGARLTSNKFFLPAAVLFSKGQYGLYLNEATGYHVETNEFTGPLFAEPGEIGLYVNNSGDNWNQIYNNTFENLQYGTIAYGWNRSSDGSLGLCIECNDYENNTTDILVNTEEALENQGIARNQGCQGLNDTLPAGNTFTQNFAGLEYNFYNSENCGFIEYVYHSENQTLEKIDPDSYYSFKTMHKSASSLYVTYTKEGACPSKLEGGGGTGHDRDGITEFNSNIADKEVMNAINERFDPMPDYMKNQILQGLNITGAKESIESQLSRWKQKRAMHFNSLYQHFRKDTLNPQLSSDSLITLLTNENDLFAKYRLAFLYLHEHNTDAMNSLLNNINSSFELTNDQQSDHQAYLILFGLLEELQSDSTGIIAIDSIQVVILETLAQNNSRFPGAYARNILIAAGLLDYEEPIIIPDLLKSSKINADEPCTEKEAEQSGILNIFPNPAKDKITVRLPEFTAEECHFGTFTSRHYNYRYYKNSVLCIYDIFGRQLREISLKDVKGDEIETDVSTFSTGIYLIALFENDKIMAKGRFIKK